MNYDKIVYPSTQLYATLPEWISEQYPRFVQFTRRSLEAQERLGFGQDILQNLEKYRDFDFYRQPIVESGVLDELLDENDTSSLTLVDGFGFPEKNGVIYLPGNKKDKCGEDVPGEVILYRYREGNVLYDLTRGASATTDLGTFVKDNTYKNTVAQTHLRGATVNNLSVLFLSSMLKTIHQTFAADIDSKWIADGIDHGTLLERFKDFFQSKGTKLGIQALFKFIFGENDVDVSYPGDRMIKASDSTWTETFIMRSVPIAELLVTPIHNYILPDRLINRELQVKSYNDLLNPETKNRVIGRAICDYVSSYEHNDVTQYEFYIQKNNVSGNFPPNPFTKLTRTLQDFGSVDDDIDVTTITVETTLGFPDSGLLFIGTEGIYYTEKSFNQFLNCTRGYINVEYAHSIGETVYGPYFIEGIEEVEDPYGRTDKLISRSWPLGLVSDVDVQDPGLLHTIDDEVFINGPGRLDPREPALDCFNENYDDNLVDQASLEPNMSDIRNRTAGVSGVYFDNDFVFVTSTNLPYHKVGTFSTDDTVGVPFQVPDALHTIPRFGSIQTNVKSIDEEGNKEYFFHDKGFREIGVFANGVPAFSNVSNSRIIQGSICEYQIINEGKGYRNPTLLVNDAVVDEEITLDATQNGRIVHITTNSTVNYENVPPLPTVEITGGRGAEIEATFDRFGRCIEVNIINGGEFYNDVPSVTLVDATNIGKGSHLTCTVKDGEIDSVTIENAGLDYNPVTTKCVVTPVGQGAEIAPIVQYYQFDRPAEVVANDNWHSDEGFGFLWEKNNNVKQWYGYTVYPPLLDENYTLPARINTENNLKIKTQVLGDYIIATPPGSGGIHSKLMGYAYDGCPIYGGNLYANGKDDTDGFKKMFSGWVLSPNRDEIIPSGGTKVATMPPSVEEYPMGTFVEDYKYIPEIVTQKVRILSSDIELIQTELEDYILASVPVPDHWILNENNAIKCNTPEYPQELYPDGVWIYVATEVDSIATFPYIIGKTFENRPISQNVLRDTEVDESSSFIIYNPESKYREKAIEFDIDKVERHRNPYLTPTKDGLILEVAHTSEGSISDIVVVDGKPNNSRVGDCLMFDNTDTGGSGALGQVDQIEGVEVEKGEGSDITTVTISHYQRLNLLSDPTAPELDEDGFPISYVFVKSSLITTSSNAEATVVDFDPLSQTLDVFTYTSNLIQPGDSFKDNKGRLVTLGGATSTGLLNASEQNRLFFNNNGRPSDRQLYFADITPTSEEATPGDLWWSIQNGRLYIFFDDGESAQWVCTQPLGMRPLAGALDEGIGTDATTTQNIVSPQSDLRVTISSMAPEERTDGTPNEPGDLWWSMHTGILYIYYNEWVVTDPNGVVSDEYALNQSNMPFSSIEIPPPYSSKQNVIISYIAPMLTPEGDALETGYLWWSPLTGKMYIYYRDTDGNNSWVITNPVGMLSTPYSLDNIPEGDGGVILPPVTPLPIPPADGEGGQNLGGVVLQKGQSIIWFEHLKDFAPGDSIKFAVGAPGTGLEEICVINRILETHVPAAAVVDRSNTVSEIFDGTPVLNVSKSLYTVTCTEPHNMTNKDLFTLSGSAYDEVNEENMVVNGEILSPSDLVFQTYMSKTYPEETGLTYVTKSERVFGEIATVKVYSPGAGYSKMPAVLGVYHREIDYGQYTVNLAGTAISDVEVHSGGSRYQFPQVFFYDIQGSGTGATGRATVVDGIIESIEVTSGGVGYVEPAMLLVETRGKFIALTNDIGQILSMKVINPGRAISPDASLKPEIMIETRCIVQFDTHTAASIIAFNGFTDYSLFGLNGFTANTVLSSGQDVSVWGSVSPGDYVYQGTADGETKQVIGEVVNYDDRRQIITLRHIIGNIKNQQYLYAEDGTRALVLREGQADTRVNVNGISSPSGRFINDNSMLSTSWAHLQDSYYYQKFSYSIESPLQQHQFDDFVMDILHPTGFIMFSDLQVRSTLKTDIVPVEAIISKTVVPILSPDNYDTKYTAIGAGELPDESNRALSPDIGTLELGDK